VSEQRQRRSNAGIGKIKRTDEEKGRGGEEARIDTRIQRGTTLTNAGDDRIVRTHYSRGGDSRKERRE